MKKRIFSLILVLILALGLSMPATALENHDKLTVAISDMSNERLQTQGTSTLPALSEQYGFDMRVDIVSDTEGQTLEDYAYAAYANYGYGYGENLDGALLMIQVEDLGGSVNFVGYVVVGEGYGRELISKSDAALMYQSLDLTLQGQGIDYMSAGVLCADAVDTFAGVMSLLIEQVSVPVSIQDAMGSADVATIVPGHVMDTAALLDADTRNALNSRAQELSQEYGCGVYVLTVDTMDGEDVRTFAENFYTENNLGVGAYRNGILFVVCMDVREYVTVTYGQDPADGEYGIGILAFTDKGIAAMEEVVAPMLSSGAYGEAFDAYLDSCEEALSYYAEHGEAEKDGGSVLGRLAIVVFVPLLIALVVCLILRSQMKTARAATSAGEYIPKDGFVLTAQRDQFIHTTHHREKIERNSGSGSGSGISVSSSGFGGSKGGKF